MRVESVESPVNPWDRYAIEYAEWVSRREPADVQEGSIVGRMLEQLGDVGGKDVLDAACGEGYLARILAARGARVTGVDVSARLIDLARAKDPDGTITYRVADLSSPLPDLTGRFDLIGSHLALNDVADYRGFAATLATLVRPGGRIVLAFNNPYSLLVRGHISDYFASGTIGVYGGMTRALGGTIHYYHRTLEEYLDAFLDAGLRLTKLADVDSPHVQWNYLPEGYRFPVFTVLAFAKDPLGGHQSDSNIVMDGPR
jgi:2-polyprenyl-3-methyl-5-hydroxy-6-metoxy-1,4-benzoquinol methylase